MKEGGNQSEPNRKKALKTISCNLSKVQKRHSIFLTLSDIFPSFATSLPYLFPASAFDCWVSSLVPDWVRGHSLVVYTFFGLWWLMPPDTLSSISRGRIIRVMQKSSGPGIAWGLSSGNPNNLHLIEFPLKNAKINEWIMWLVCLTGLHHVVWDRGVFLQLFLNVEFQHHHILKYLVVFNCTINRQNISCCNLHLKARV